MLHAKRQMQTVTERAAGATPNGLHGPTKND
jgi:hypothetical protein